MKKTVLAIWLTSMTLLQAADGLVEIKSRFSVQETAVRLVGFFREKGIRLFKVIDHAEGAAKTGEKLRPTTLLIFGNPYLGTPLMKCRQSVAVDLPQKMLVYQNETGETVIAYNDPDYLVRRHGIDPKCAPQIVTKMKNVLKKIAAYAAGR